MSVRLMPLDELALNWWRVEPLLCRATQITGCYEPIDVLQLAMAGQVGVWLCGDIDAVIVTEVENYPRRRGLEMMFCGGDNMASWLRDAIEIMDEHARQFGCSHIACIGRPGWERAWDGRRTGDVVMVRDIPERHVDG
jgi:hypothetical protein